MLKGKYEYIQTDHRDCPIGHILINVSETEKKYSFELLEDTTRYDYDHFVLLFKGKYKVSINKQGGKCAMMVWSDNDFTIYPFQAGIPFWFVKEKS